MFKNSKNLLEQVQARAHELGYKNVSVALSDTAAGAQALTQHFDFFISEPGQEAQSLAPFPTASLKDLEGLKAWEKPHHVEDIADFLHGLGLRSLGDLMKLPADSWNLRWGDLGTQIQKRLAGIERHAWTPWLPTEPLVAYQHLDFPISNQDILMESVTPRLKELLFRLEGREQALDHLSLLLICEYSNHKQTVSFSPTLKARDLQLTLTLLNERLSKINLDNPIREWELEIQAVASQSKQLDFWEPQTSEKEHLLRLQSLLHDRQIESGFLKLQDSQLPEKSWAFQKEPNDFELPQTEFAMEDQAHRELPVFSEGLNHAPRPTRLLEPPLPITMEEMRTVRFLHRYPIERLDLPWQNAARDYWLAMNSQQQCVWVYRDLKTTHYFLHGYFD